MVNSKSHSLLTYPRFLSIFPHTKDGTRVPPSHIVAFPPLSGQLLPPKKGDPPFWQQVDPRGQMKVTMQSNFYSTHIRQEDNQRILDHFPLFQSSYNTSDSSIHGCHHTWKNISHLVNQNPKRQPRQFNRYGDINRFSKPETNLLFSSTMSLYISSYFLGTYSRKQ